MKVYNKLLQGNLAEWNHPLGVGVDHSMPSAVKSLPLQHTERTADTWPKVRDPSGAMRQLPMLKQKSRSRDTQSFRQAEQKESTGSRNLKPEIVRLPNC